MMIERLTPSHAVEYRTLMLEAYAGHPDAFTSTVTEREKLPLSATAMNTSSCFRFMLMPIVIMNSRCRFYLNYQFDHALSKTISGRLPKKLNKS